MVTIELSINKQAIGKLPKSQAYKMGGANWEPWEGSLADLYRDHYERGYAFSPSRFKDNHKTLSSWLSSEWFVLDVDDYPKGDGEQWSAQGWLANNPAVREHAVMIVPSSSYTSDTPKVHIWFRLDEKITDAGLFKQVAQGIVYTLEQSGEVPWDFKNVNTPDDLKKASPDNATFNPAQGIYGTRYKKINAQPVVGDDLSYFNADAVPVGVARMKTLGMQYAYRAAKWEGEINGDATNAPAVKTSRDLWHGEANQTLLQTVLDALGATEAQLNGNGWYSGLRCPFHEHTHSPNSFGINATSGKGNCFPGGADGGEKATFNLKQIATQLGIEVKDNRFYEPANNTITPDVTLNTRYLSGDLLTEQYTGHVIVRAPMGTGKTTSVKPIVVKNPNTRFIILNHRVALANALSKALSKGVKDMLKTLSYKNLSDNKLLEAMRVAICINSIHRLVEGDEVPSGVILVIDEIEQLLAHLHGATFFKNEAAQALETLEQMIEQAQRVILLDAHITDISITWLRGLLNDVVFIENVYAPVDEDKKPLILNSKAASVEERALAAAHKEAGNPDGLTILFAGGKDRCAKLHKLAEDQRLKSVLLTSDTVKVKEDGVRESNPVLDDINDHISEHKPDIIFYSPTLGSGVSIDVPVAAVYGVFTGGWLPASEIWQMLGRARDVRDGLHVYIQPVTHGSRVTDGEYIYNLYVALARKTGENLFKWWGGRRYLYDNVAHLYKLLTMIEAHRNHSLNWLEASFLDLNPGYTVTRVSVGVSDEHKDASADVKERLQAERLKAVLEAEQIDGGQADHLKRLDGLTADERFMFTRYQIEKATGGNVNDNPALVEQYMANSGGADVGGLYNLAMYRYNSYYRLLSKDKGELMNLPDKRGHYAHRVIAARSLLKAVYGGSIHGGQIPASHIKTCVSTWGGADDFFTDNLGYTPKTALGVFKKVLGWLGLSVERTKTHTEGERVTYYTLTPESLDHMRYCKQGYMKREAEAIEAINRKAHAKAALGVAHYTPITERDDTYWKGVLMKDEEEEANTSENTADTL